MALAVWVAGIAGGGVVSRWVLDRFDCFGLAFFV